MNMLWYVAALSKYSFVGSVVARFMEGTRFFFVGVLYVAGMSLSAAAAAAYPRAPFPPCFKTVAYEGLA